MSALDDIAAERKRQIEVEGWSVEHDDRHDCGEMADAAAVYAMQPSFRICNHMLDNLWPWSREWWKPANRRRDLVKAGALIVAEIERLDRSDDKP